MYNFAHFQSFTFSDSAGADGPAAERARVGIKIPPPPPSHQFQCGAVHIGFIVNSIIIFLLSECCFVIVRCPKVAAALR